MTLPFDERLIETLMTWFADAESGSSFSSGLDVGMTLTIRHPEWAQAALKEQERLRALRGATLPADSTPERWADVIVERTPIEVVDTG